MKLPNLKRVTLKCKKLYLISLTNINILTVPVMNLHFSEFYKVSYYCELHV